MAKLAGNNLPSTVINSILRPSHVYPILVDDQRNSRLTLRIPRLDLVRQFGQ